MLARTPRRLSRSTLSAVLQIGIGLATFLLVARGILTLASYPTEDPIWAKLQWLESGEHGGYELIFFGSSRIQSGVDPEVFDRVAVRNGWDVRSFNLAADGAEAEDVDFLLRRVLAARPPGWRYAVIEARPWLGRTWGRENALIPRTIYFRDFESTWRSVYAALRFGGSHDETTAVRLHLLGFAARLGAAGRGPDAVRRMQNRPPPWASHESLIEDRGYRRSPRWTHRGAPADCFGELPVSDEEWEERARARLRRSPWTPPDFAPRPDESLEEARRRALEHVWLQPFRRQQERLRAAGIVPVFFTPSLNSWTPDLEAYGVVDTFLSYDDPRRIPEIFRPEHRYDCSHVDESGARIFSRHMARDLARLARERP